ncbi:MAG: hypothetical protein ACRDIE_11800 [Chloroflexota bacterium]
MVEPTPVEPISESDNSGVPTIAHPFDVPWTRIVALVLGFRVLLTIVGSATYLLLPQAGQPTGPAAILLGPWRHFDALRFTQIAAHGYAADGLNTAYMPIYPFLIRVVSAPLFGHYLTAGLVVSNLGCVLGIGLLWRWVADDFGERVAWRAVLVMLLYPDSFYLLGAYSESVFLAFCAGALLAVRRDRLVPAGVLALLAVLTRLQGLVLIVPLLLALRGRREPAALVRGMGAAALPALGLLVYQKVLSGWLGGGAILDTFQEKWHIALLAPWQTIQQYVTVIRSPRWHLIDSPTANYVLLWDLVAALTVLTVLLLGARRLGLDLTLFGIAAWCFALSRYLSTGRYMLAVLPAFIVAALWLDDTRLRRLAWFAIPLLFFFTAEFAQGSWLD